MSLPTRSSRFTTLQIRTLKNRAKPYKVIEEAPRGEGRLIVRVHSSGLKEFYYRTRSAGIDQLLRIGRFEQTHGDGGMSLAAARSELAKLVALQRSTGDAKAELARRKAEAVEAQNARDRAARLGTFEQLLDAYVADLRARGRVSARAVESTFNRDVKKKFPDLCRSLAKSITPRDIQEILAQLVRRGLRRGVNLLRTYLSAAFQHGGKADHDPTRLDANGATFEIDSNPVHLVPRKAEFEVVGERTLSQKELARYWHGMDEVLPIARAFLRLDLTLGGQRGVQLLRPTWHEYDFDAKTVLLKDSKGRGSLARDHLLPLPDLALEVLAPLRLQNDEESGPFQSRNRKRLHPSTVSKVVNEIWMTLAREDCDKGEKPIERFSFRDIRRTCETQLASLGVSRDIRAQLLSHGRSGVQARHYDRYAYLKEKRLALILWNRHLARLTENQADHLKAA